MSNPPFRPTRPTQTKASASAEAAKFTATAPVRLSIRVDPSTLRSIRRSAVLADKTIKRFVLDALRSQGVEVAEHDITDTKDT